MKYLKIALVTTLILCSFNAFGAVTGAGALPWEGGLTAIVASFTGPVAYAVSVLGIIIGIAILMFGNDLNAFGRTIVFMILAASVIVTAANTLTVFTGVGATITREAMSFLVAFLSSMAAITVVQELFLRLFRKNTNADPLPAM